MITTTLDARFSDADATATPWPDARAVLESAQLSWISTVRADGRPHVTPLVAVWLEDALYFTTGPDEQKAVNLRANPHVVVTTGCNDWTSGLDVVVEGDAVRVSDDALLQELAVAWRAKWDGQWDYEPRNGAFWHPGGGAAPVYEVAPRKVLAFGKGTFTHTTHQF